MQPHKAGYRGGYGRRLVCALTLCCSMGTAAWAEAPPAVHAPLFSWSQATVYFLLTDRFAPAPGYAFSDRHSADAAPWRGFLGGQLKGVTHKIREGYFDALGVNVLWLTPPVEQISQGTDEGSGLTYAYHGYWARDFTRVDPRLGSAADLHELVDTAHAHGIRVLLDVVLNHTGPVTEGDPAWPEEWVRTGPACTYRDVPSTVQCTLVKNLPDLRTERSTPVALPAFLLEKWRSEGRLEQEQASLDAFFARTGWPRTPAHYLIKWQTDWVRHFGFDGFRADTVKHVEPEVWSRLGQEAERAYADWNTAHPRALADSAPFWMLAELYGYTPHQGRRFTYDGGAQVDFYDAGFAAMINFAFKSDATWPYETLFSRYAALLHGPLQGVSVLNYLSSHDDGAPFDPLRKHPLDAANRLLLAPGAAQIYYGDETARLLDDALARGDAKLRGPMNWAALASPSAQSEELAPAQVLAHWQKLGQFRARHRAIGMGTHQKISAAPYAFWRHAEADATRAADDVIVALDVPFGRAVHVPVRGIFPEGSWVREAYSGRRMRVVHGVLEDTPLVVPGHRTAVLLFELAGVPAHSGSMKK